MEDEGSYKPDFSAHVGGDLLRCIRISKVSFDKIASTGNGESFLCLDGSPNGNTNGFMSRRLASKRVPTGLYAFPGDASHTNRERGQIRTPSNMSASSFGEDTMSKLQTSTPASQKGVQNPGYQTSSGVPDAEMKAEEGGRD